MIPVEQALQIILENTQDFGVEEVPFLESLGRVLKEDIVADRDFPPFNRVAMDGIAINHRFFEHGVRDFKIEGVQPAGSPQATLENAAHCYEVMTGAVLPENTDTVIRYEDLTIDTLMATVNVSEVIKGKNIHTKGQDRQQGEVLVPQNRVITAAEMGVIATVGKASVKVAKVPKVMIVSTGDELVEVEQTPAAHQIHAETDHIVDDKAQLKEKIARHLETYDALIFSGAVSKGKFDFLPEVLEELGVEKLFHRVVQRPGKPFWYGVVDGKSIFAFPGNPVSTYVNCLAYFYPWYAKSTGFELKEETVILGEDVTFKPSLSYFLQVKIEIKYGHLVAIPVKGNGSGDLASLVEADGFIQLPSDQTDFKQGETHSFIRYR
jgi:molybdopterin molybdotransferase